MDEGSFSFTVPHADLALPVLVERAPAPARARLVLAHGAGGALEHPRMRARAAALLRAGFDLVRFGFPWSVRGSGPPDRLELLVEAYRAVVAACRARGLAARPFLLGGHSLGGRVASLLAARGEPCDGLVLLSYPLHPAREPERLRVEHLGAISVPVFCAQGTRDALCRPPLLERTLADLERPWSVQWIEGADHDLRLRRDAQRALETELGPEHGSDAGLELAARAAARWARTLAAGGPEPAGGVGCAAP